MSALILADFGGIGALLLVAVLGASLILSIGIAVFDRRRIQFVLTGIACLCFGLFCIVFVLAVPGWLQADHYPPFGLLIPPIAAIQFVLCIVGLLRRSSPRKHESTRNI